MRAVIPVAGFGTRLKPHTFSSPKVLLNVGGKPIIGHILDKLIKENITKATFIVGYLGDKIKQYVSTTYPTIDASYVLQSEMLGLGHAIYTAIPTFDEDELLIILGDTVFDVNVDGVFDSKISSLGVKTVDDPRRFGVAITENDRIVKLVEKPQTPVSKLALVGLYYISDKNLFVNSLEELVEKDIRTKGELQLTDALQIMIDKGAEIKTFPVEGWYDCGKPETLLSTNEFLLSRNGTNRKLENVVVKHPVFIADSAIVKDSVIGPFATIAENCLIENSNIKNSIISSGAKVNCTMLDSSIVGSNAIIDGSFKTINAGDSSEIKFY